MLARPATSVAVTRPDSYRKAAMIAAVAALVAVVPGATRVATTPGSPTERISTPLTSHLSPMLA